MDAIFRNPSESDLDQLLQFMAALYAEDGATQLIAGRAREALCELLRDDERGRVWLIEVGGVPAGYLVLTWSFSLEFLGRDAFVDELYVAPPYRGSGVGRQALALAEEQCKAQGVQALHLEVESGNDRARALYQRRGFLDRGYRLLTKRLAE